MQMKNLYLVSYDIMNSQRLHVIYKTMRGFGERAQYSVFFCKLNQKEKVILITTLLEIINQNEDRIMIIDLGCIEGQSEKRIEVLGKQAPPIELPLTVV